MSNVSAIRKAQLWTPAEISTEAWYDAADEDTIAESGGAVSQWDDKSGNDYHLTQGTGSEQPETGSRTIGGLNVLDFSADHLINTSGGAVLLPDNQETFVFVVAEYDSSVSQIVTYFSDSGGRVANSQYNGYGGDNVLECHIGSTFEGGQFFAMVDDGSASVKAEGGTLATGTPYVQMGLLDRTSDAQEYVEVWADGTQQDTAVLVVTTDNRTCDTFIIGRVADTGSSRAFDGILGEVIIVHDIDTATRQLIEGYLAWKWGLEDNLPADHPYKWGAPTTTLWSPADITTQLWCDASDEDTITDAAGSVSQWDDKSGNVLNLEQTTAADQPVTGSVTIGGLNALYFDGSNDFMQTGRNPFGASITDAFVIMVQRSRDVSTQGTAFSLTGEEDTDTSRWQAHLPWSDGIIYFDVAENGGDNRVQAASGWSDNEIHIASFYCSTTDDVQQIYIDGALLAGDATGHSVAPVANILIGTGEVDFQGFDLGEVIIINGTVTTATRQLLEGYLAWKWGLESSLPSTHPYRYGAPSA